MSASVRALPQAQRPNLADVAKHLQIAEDKLAFFEDSLVQANLVSVDNPLHRFEHGIVSDDVVKECRQLDLLLGTSYEVLFELQQTLLHLDDSMSPKEREAQARAANDLGPHLNRLGNLTALFRAWSVHDAIPLAKWMESVNRTVGREDIALCASPMTGATGLIKGLWRTASAVVCTSATLTACGEFDYFERMSGLNRFVKRTTGIMPSPFDYERQGQLRLPRLTNTPKQAGFSGELSARLPGLLSEHLLGQLVLFTSRRQMTACHEALPEVIKDHVLVQGFGNRQDILKKHRDRVTSGLPSILFGLQSMGEGLDLPGDLCSHVLIDKLPFTPPSSPVDESLSEWLKTQGRDAFDEIAVPRVSMKLAQWVGRGIRTVNDFATITICDTRLTKTGFGKKILAGLPSFSRA